MIKKTYLIWIAYLFFGVSLQAQTKKWTLEECVQYALENNISIRYSDSID
jgi:outer membrane protein